MIVPYLAALAQGVNEALAGKKGNVAFFDGPFAIDFSPTYWGIQVVPNGVPGIPSCEVVGVDLASSVLDAGQQLLEACERSGWGADNDVRRLRLAVTKLV